LDGKINEIRSEIDNAKNLKRESEELLQKYKNKTEAAHAESNQIINSEKKETEIFIKESEKKFEQLIDNKKKSLEQKLDQMKIKAMKDIQNISNKIAIEAVKKIILDQENNDKMKVINQKNLEKTFNQLKQTKIS
jgi:F-type H+-transporting ATPase subunit b